MKHCFIFNDTPFTADSAKFITRTIVIQNSMKVLVSILASTVLLIGCAPSSGVIKNEALYKNDYTGKMLVLLPVDKNSVIINNKDDVQDDFLGERGEAEEIITAKLNKKLIDNVLLFTSGLKIRYPDSSFNTIASSDFFTLNKFIEKDSVFYSFSIPKKEFFTDRKTEPDLKYPSFVLNF